MSGAVVVIGLVILLHIFLPWTDPAVVPTRYIGFSLVIIELLFTVPVYFSRSETTKNMLTTMIWILTAIYFFMFIYLISTLYSPQDES